MSKRETKKKVIVTTSKKVAPTIARSKSKSASQQAAPQGPLVFGKTNLILVLTGIGLIAFGLILMSGGSQPSPDVWDENIIYSSRRILVGPFVIIIGLVIEIVAIFRNPGSAKISETSA